MSLRPLAITMGDPAGVGPEIIVKAVAELQPRIELGELSLVVIGSNPALEQARAKFTPGIAIPTVTEDDAAWPALCALQAGPEGEPIWPGVLSADGGRFAFQAVERGVRLAMEGRIGGIVTAPLNKEALNKAGYHYPGHTEMLAELTGVKGSCMMLAHGNMRVSHVTTHIALEDVPKRATPERLRRVIDLTHDAISLWRCIPARGGRGRPAWTDTGSEARPPHGVGFPAFAVSLEPVHRGDDPKHGAEAEGQHHR